MGLARMNASSFAKLSDATLRAVLARLDQIDRERRLERYSPYTKQLAFHAGGAAYRERLLRAGNQLGKTYSGAAEMAYHLTGDYPAWWPGRKWAQPIRAWAGGKDGVSVRDSVALLLLGPPGERGTGLIPKSAIVDIAPSRGIADGVDHVTVRHAGGGNSRLTFKTYDQGRERWQAATLELVWFDEEPPQDIYTEGLTRTNATGGMVYMTFTPLLGMSEVVRRFLMEESLDRHDTNMIIEDAEHIPASERARIVASYPPHEREARTKGVPVLGSGRIFPVPEEDIAVQQFPIPKYWPRLGAMDFGYDHPFAAVELAYDDAADIVYVTKAHRSKNTTPIAHVAALKPWGATWLPWAWPHDGLQHDKGSGDQLAKQYKGHGLNMIGNRATFPDGSNGVEAGLMLMLDRMETGRLKVFAHLIEWFEEFRLYHRKDGKVVKEAEDLMAATRYGVMMLRHALLPPELRAENRRKRAQASTGADPLADF
jgi:phage terminase large subunit-like protein